MVYEFNLKQIAKIEASLGVPCSHFANLFLDGGKGVGVEQMALVVEMGTGKPFTGDYGKLVNAFFTNAVPALLPKAERLDEAEVEGE